MAEIFSFKSNCDLRSDENLSRFIKQCKNDLIIFGDDLDWEQLHWPKAAIFVKLGANSRAKREQDSLDKRFIDFAKSYFRYRQAHRRSEAKNELKALRVLEAAFFERGCVPEISNISISILDQAAALTREYYAKSTACNVGQELSKLAIFLSSKELVPLDVSGWKNPIKYPTDNIRTGQKAKNIRNRKMPSEAALNALAEIFANSPECSKDIFTSATFALLMCAPSRITEVLELPVDCELEQEDSTGAIRYGWRFYSDKGFGANIKWIPTEMVGVAKQAIARIKQLTFEARELAKWIEENGDKFYRHSGCPDVLETAPLSIFEACQALGMANHSRKVARSSLITAKLMATDGAYNLSSLWQHVLSKQPKGFPWVNKSKGIKYSNALFCMKRNIIHKTRPESPVILWKPTSDSFNNDVSPRNNMLNHRSIFDRHGYTRKDGSRVKLTSHQARHLLNTIAQRGGLSQLEIAKWSGRADVKQNKTYNHMSEYEMVSLAEKLDVTSPLFGPSTDLSKHIPVSIKEFNTMEKGPVHVTEFGVCVHDFIISPCEKYRDCLNCTEQICIKGDDEKLSRMKKRLEFVEEQYVSAKKAVEAGSSGADRWYEYHKNTSTRIRELIAIIEDPELPDGTQVKLRNDLAFSPLRRAVRSKKTNSSLQDPEEVRILDDISRLLGDDIG